MKIAFLPQNHDLYCVQWRQLKADALEAMEPMMLAAVPVEDYNPANIPDGQIVPREVFDELGKLKVVK